MTTQNHQNTPEHITRNEGVSGSNPLIGSQENTHGRAKKAGASAPTAPTETNPTHQKLTTLLQRAIDAYTQGNTRAGEKYLAEAWPLALPYMHGIINKRIQEHDRRLDAQQEAFLKIWQAIQNWNPPTKRLQSGAALCRWFAHKAALNIIENRDRTNHRETHSLNDELADGLQYDPNQKETVSDTLSLTAFADYVAQRASNHAQAQLWRKIIDCVADGHADRESIGQEIGVTGATIRREIRIMLQRDIDLRALDHIETIVYDTADKLFDFDFKEIA